ncbi:TolC family outer membrane protein [uncultured Devosia sp.]|uniref:TolC family outer membrane protein n=1 Tax=uncultured Devosia sp. TaxID=211434 RepID=UPI0035CB8279
MYPMRVLLAGALAIALGALPVAAQAETLAEALASAYTNNPNIESARISVKSAAEDIALRQANKRPTIAANITGSYDWSLADGNYSSTDSLTGGLSYNQNLFDNFQTDAQIEQARALADLSGQTLRNAEQNVLLSVVQAYMNVIRDTQLVSSRQESITFYDAQLKSANDRLEVGEGTKIDVAQAQARQAQAVASLRAAQTSLQTSQASYQRWVGHRPSNLSSNVGFAGLIPGSIDAAIASAEERHPAILSAKAAIRSGQAGTDAAQAAFGPTLDLIGSLCGFGCFGEQDVSGVSGSVRLSLSIPIYAGGALGASVRKANLEQIKSEVDAMSTYDEVRESVITSWATLQNSAAQIESAQASVSSVQQVLNGVIQERDLGQRTTLDVLNSQAELTTSKETLIQASSSRVIAMFTLIASTGRLSAAELNLPVSLKSGDNYTRTVEDVWQELRVVAD